jgi:hypothetical protein
MTVLTDTFTRANADALGGSWTEVTGDTDINTNAARTGNIGISDLARLELDLASDDHSVQASIRASEVGSAGFGGVLARFHVTDQTFYEARAQFQADTIRLNKVVAGAVTQLGSDAAVAFDAAVDYLVRIEVNGSDIRVYVDGSLKISVTDTTITGNTRTGIRGSKFGSGYIQWDNFEAADIVPATMAAPLGALTATITATVEHPAMMAAPLGALTATMTATVTGSAPTVFGVLAAPLGGLTATITATVEVPAIMAAPLGALTATITATVEVPASFAAPLGGLTATITATVVAPATITVSIPPGVSSHLRYEVLSVTGTPLSRELNPTQPGTVTSDHGARTLSGLTLDPTETPPERDERIRVVWIDAPTGNESSLGQFLYKGGAERHGPRGIWIECFAMPDRLDLLRRPTVEPIGIEPGALLTTRAAEIALEAGFTDDELDIEPSGQALGDTPLAYVADRLAPLDAISKLLGYLPPHIIEAALVLRPVPRPLYQLADRTDLSLGSDANIHTGSLVSTPPSGLAPNIVIVRSTSPTGAPITGRWDGPAGLPNSIERVGELPIFFDVAGLESEAQANEAAASLARLHPAIGTTDTYNTALIPDAGAFDVVNRDGTNKLETVWQMPLPLGPMAHTLTEAYADAA